jgi:hypothetical protein
MKILIGFTGLMGIFLACGCSISKPVSQPQVQFYLDKTADFASIGKVAVLELEDESVSSPDLGKTLTRTLADTLGKKQLFSIRTVYRTDPEWKGLNLDQAQSLSSQAMSQIQKQLKVDAILIGTISRYRSYPQLLAAMRFKLLDLRNGKLLWAMENVWDSTDKNTEERIKQFFDTQMRTGYQPMNWQFVTKDRKSVV